MNAMQMTSFSMETVAFKKFNMATVHHVLVVGVSHGTTHEVPFIVTIECKNFVTMVVGV